MNQLKVGIVGCGAHGRGHIQSYAEIPEAEIIAVVDLNPDRAQKAAVEFGVPHHYTDYREMLERHPLDIVSLALPPAANREAAVAAFEAGANVLVSKPLAMNLAEAEGMIAAAKALRETDVNGLAEPLQSRSASAASIPRRREAGQCLPYAALARARDAHPGHPHHVQAPPGGRGRAFPYNRPPARRNPLGVGKPQTGARFGGKLSESAQDEDSPSSHGRDR